MRRLAPVIAAAAFASVVIPLTVAADSHPVACRTVCVKPEALAEPLTQFSPTPPTRLLDTRTGYGIDLAGRVFPGQVVGVIVPGNPAAVAVNLKLVDASGGGWAVAWAGRTPIPTASNIDDNGTSPINSYAVAEVDPICSCFRVFFSAQLTSHLVVDLLGFWTVPVVVEVGPPPTLPRQS